MDFLKTGKAKLLAIVSAFALVSSSAMAAISVDESTGAISGTLELAPFYSGAAVILTALASLVVVKWVIGFFRRA